MYPYSVDLPGNDGFFPVTISNEQEARDTLTMLVSHTILNIIQRDWAEEKREEHRERNLPVINSHVSYYINEALKDAQQLNDMVKGACEDPATDLASTLILNVIHYLNSEEEETLKRYDALSDEHKVLAALWTSALFSQIEHPVKHVEKLIKLLGVAFVEELERLGGLETFYMMLYQKYRDGQVVDVPAYYDELAKLEDTMLDILQNYKRTPEEPQE